MEKLIPLTEEHLPHLVGHLREWDKKELTSFLDVTIEESLRELVGKGEVWISPKGNPCVVCGLTPNPEDPSMGIPYLLATDEFYQHTHKFAKESKLWVADALTKYTVIFNAVAAENIVAIRWLQWLGFSFDTRIDNLGRHGLSFYPFYMRRK